MTTQNIFSVFDSAAGNRLIMLESLPDTDIGRVLMGNMNAPDRAPELFYRDIPVFLEDTLHMD